MMKTRLLYLILLTQSTSFAAWQVAPDGDDPDRLMKFIPRNPNISMRAPVGEPCQGKVIRRIDKTTFLVYMRNNYPLAGACEMKEGAGKSGKIWRLAPISDSPDSPLKHIPRNKNIPERAPIGEPCLGSIIRKIDKKTAWVYMRSNYDLAAVCEWIDGPHKQQPSRFAPKRRYTPQKVEMLTVSNTYDETKAPAEAAFIVSYVRGSMDGNKWSPWKTHISKLTGCIKFKVRKAVKYEYKEAYANRNGVVGPMSGTITIKPGKGKPKC